MRILYIGTYRNRTRDAHWSENLARSLVASEHEVICRSTLSSLPSREVHPDVAATEMLSLRALDVVIQDVDEHVYMSGTPWKNLYIDPFNEYQHLHCSDYLKNENPLDIKDTEGTFRVYSIVDGPSQDLLDNIKYFLGIFRPYHKVSHTIFVKNPDGVDELCQRARKELNCTQRARDIIVPIPEDQFSFPNVHWYGDLLLKGNIHDYAHSEAWAFGNISLSGTPEAILARYNEWVENPIQFNLQKSKSLMDPQHHESPGMVAEIMERINEL